MAAVVVFLYRLLDLSCISVIGQDFHKSRMFKAKEIEGEVKYAVRRQEETIYKKQLRLANPELDRFRDLMLYNLEAGGAVLIIMISVFLYRWKRKFRALIHEMKQARYIHMQYYIIRSDELWQEIEPVLIQKQKKAWRSGSYLTVWAAEQCIKDWNRLKAGGTDRQSFPGVAWKAAASYELPKPQKDRSHRRTDRTSVDSM